MKDAIILFKFASRSRPQKFKEAMKSITDNLARPELAKFIFTFDENDPTKDQYNVVLDELGKVDYSATFGVSVSKIHACNRDLEEASTLFPDWKILVCMSDDMLFVHKGFDNVIREDFQDNFPDSDGFLHYNDGYQKANVCTLSIIGRKYFERDNYIYDPNFVGLWCDVQATEMAYIRGKHKYMGDSKIICRHIHPKTSQPHPVTGQVAQLDEQYNRDENMKRWGEDSIVLKHHRSLWYGIPPEERVNGFLFDKDAELIEREKLYRREFGDGFVYPKPVEISNCVVSHETNADMYSGLTEQTEKQKIVSILRKAMQEIEAL